MGAPDAAPDRPATVAGRDPASILVVDDDPQTLRHVRDALADAGYAPVVTGEHRELVQIIRVEMPALVLLDLRRRNPNGLGRFENSGRWQHMTRHVASRYRSNPVTIW